MPAIKQYSAGTDLTLRPDDRGASSQAQAARVVGALYNSAASMQAQRGPGDVIKIVGGEVSSYLDHRELSLGAASKAEMLSNLTDKWNTTVKEADPNDPSTAAEFREKVMEPALEKWSGSFWTGAGQKFAERSVATLREHMFNKTTADMSSLAGQAAADNAKKLINTLSNLAKNDPSSLPEAMRVLQEGVTAMTESSPNLRGITARQLHGKLLQTGLESVVKAGVMGAIERNPDEGVKLASDPRLAQYISGEEVKRLESYARTNIRAQRAEERYGKMMEKEALQDRSDKAEEEYLVKLNDTKEIVSPRDIVRDDRLTRQSKERMLGIVERYTQLAERAGKMESLSVSDGAEEAYLVKLHSGQDILLSDVAKDGRLSREAKQRLLGTIDRYERVTKKEVQKDTSDAAEVEYLTKFYSSNEPVTPGDIVQDPRLTREAKERVVNTLNRIIKPESLTKVSNAKVIDLLRRIRAPEDDPLKINNLDPVYDAMIEGKLTKADFNFVRNEFLALRTPEGEALGRAKSTFYKAVEGLFEDPILGKMNAERKLQFYNYQTEIERKVNELRKAGKSPYTLFDPRSPDYVGNPAFVQKFIPPLQERIRSFSRGMLGSPTEETGRRRYNPATGKVE